MRRQALAIQALLLLIEWGSASRAERATGIPLQTTRNRTSWLYHLLGVEDQLNATLLLWPLIQDIVVVRDRYGRVLG